MPGAIGNSLQRSTVWWTGGGQEHHQDAEGGRPDGARRHGEARLPVLLALGHAPHLPRRALVVHPRRTDVAAAAREQRQNVCSTSLLSSSIGFFMFTLTLSFLASFIWVTYGITEFDWVLPSYIRFYPVIPGLTGSYWVFTGLLSLTGFYLVSLGFT